MQEATFLILTLAVKLSMFRSLRPQTTAVLV